MKRAIRSVIVSHQSVLLLKAFTDNLFVNFIGYAPVTVITCLDELKSKEDKEEAFEQASWATGSSSERTHFIANYTNEAPKQSLEVDRAALDILDSALLSAEGFIQIRKQREKNRMEREAMAGGNIFGNSVEA